MKNIIINSIMILFVFSNLFSQTIRGNIKFSDTKEFVKNANIKIYNLNDSLIYSTVSDNKGFFEIKNIEIDKLKIIVSYLGYENYEKTINIDKFNNIIDLDISLKERIFITDEVVVKSNIGITQISPGRIVYSSIDLPSVKGGNAGDIFKNMTSVFMGGRPQHNRDVRFRGLGNAYSQILINGKKSGVSGNNRETVLDMIPAENIDYIEIISVPSAEYSSEGLNGIINIVTKKNIKNSNFKVNTGLDNNSGYTAGLNFSTGIDNIELFSNYSKLNRLIDKNKDVSKSNFKSNKLDSYDIQTENEDSKFTNDFINAGIKYNINKNNIVNFEVNFNNQIEDKDKINKTLSFKSDSSFKDDKRINGTETNNKFSSDYSLDYKIILSPFSQINTNIFYKNAYEDVIKNDIENKYNSKGENISPNPKKTNRDEFKRENNIFGGVVYQYLLENLGTLKIGYNYNLLQYNSTLNLENFNYKTSEWEKSSSGGDNFILDEYTNVLFADSKIKFGNYQINLGLRFESLVQESQTKNKDNKSISYNNLVLPSLNFLYNLDSTQYITLSLGKRLRKAGFKDLNPFIDDKDPLKIKQGNPELKPEIAWAYEIGYMKNFDFASFGTNLFRRDISNIIQKVITSDTNGIIYEKPNNFSSGYLMGIELISSIKVFNWCNINLNYSYFDSKINDSNFEGEALNDQIQWLAKFITDFHLPYKIKLQISGNYLGPKPSSTKSENEIYFVDLGLNFPIIFNFEGYLRISDLFDTLNKVKNNTTSNVISKEIENTRGPIINFGISWRI